MTALGKVVRTTAFKLSAMYFVVFSVFAVVFVGWISRETDAILTQQVKDSIEAEIGILADEGLRNGLTGIVAAIEQRSRAPGASLYVITDSDGHVVAGNVTEVPPSLLKLSGLDPVTVPYKRLEADTGRHVAMVQVLPLPNGLRMLVGRDISEIERIRSVVGRAMVLGLGLLICLALLSWFFVSRRVLKRIDSVSATSRQIMAGDLSGRLEVTGTGDEFDRLAQSLNAMLDRIEHLLYGLKDVSDNIAHDLKTPLTRLRTRVEATLAGPERTEPYKAALEATIEESDQLIRTFNALLMIARIEAGSPDGAMGPIDMATIAAEVAELYEPVAEEAEVFLALSLEEPLPMTGSRELISQALANLLDNAIKYVKSGDEREGHGTVGVTARREGDEIVVSVRDNGPGIPAEDRERVLQRFVRLEKSRSQPGSGLGLSLVDAVTKLHHGAISLSDAGPGLIVTLRFPASD
ncbi:HAMP domain-containing sensor histidine kinase [Kaistia dalseonensis]|uniref:histidine kinase n=1 Tax=Kaistia dalseonensis TaxID=410840 RepID=A0ABU0H2F1_9HYPH|nr:HAMP domain-containing sensor histidine kinase [Kaistia dalseonensis]MCX5493104.1 HAMP domain-containing sensor histidine kinase [Kaistia dalseonensis]MDQ0435659.1 signal transduction histidine kinase [Kaistia dalseonensis]